MTTESDLNGQREKKIVIRHGGGSDAVYGIGIFGAWAFYFGRATTNEERVRAFFKGLFWPAFLVHALFEFLENK